MDVRDKSAMNPLIAELLLESVKRNDEEAVKVVLESPFDRHGRCAELSCVASIDRDSWLKVVSNTKLGSCIGVCDWLQGVYLASKNRCYRILGMFFKIENFIRGVTGNGWTVLHLAMFQCEHLQGNKSDFELVEILLDSGRFQVNALTDQQETVLHFACRCQAPDAEVDKITSLLLRRKVNRNQVNLFGQTALMVACKTGSEAAVLALLKEKDKYGDKLDINVKDNGETAFTLAKKGNNAEIVTMMTQALFLAAVENGDREAVKVYLDTPDECDLQFGEIRIAKGATEYEVLYSRTETTGRSSSKLTTDDEATYTDSDELQLNKMDVVRTPSYTGPITFPVWLVAVGNAHRKSDDGMVNLLLNVDRFIRGLNENGQTVLHVAIVKYLSAGYDPIGLQVMKLLLESSRCDANALNSQRETVLHLYCKGEPQRNRFNDDEDKLLKILLEHGIDVNRRNIQGKTALMVACVNQRIDIVRWLLDPEKNAEIRVDIDATDASGETALMLAERKDNVEIVALLQKVTFLAAVENGNIAAVKSILSETWHCNEMLLRSWNAVSYVSMAKKGSRLSKRPIDRSTWIEGVSLAIENSSEDILKLLLDYDIIVQTQEGKTGDHVLNRFFYDTHLFDHRRLRLTEVLLKSDKFNVNALNFEAQTLLHSIFGGCRRATQSFLCVGGHSNLIHSVVELFLNHGVSVNQKDKEGKTALLIASEIGCSLIMRTILTWARRTGTRLDLDARDRNGRTALMKAAIWKRPEDAEMLLNTGASVNLSDNRGFTALHHALYEAPSPESLVNFGDFPKNYESFKTRKEVKVNLVENEKPHYRYNRNRSELNQDVLKLVELLVRTTKVDVNALDYEGYSPLDIAHAAIPDISLTRPIIDSLEKKGATLNIFKPGDFHTGLLSLLNHLKSHYYNWLSSNASGLPGHKSDVSHESPLHRLARMTKFQVQNNENIKMAELERFEPVGKMSPFILDQFIRQNTGKMEVFTKILWNVYPDNLRQFVSVKDHRNRNPLHYIVIYCKGYSPMVQRNAFVKMLIECGCSVNEADSYGRTPLHYAHEPRLRELLKSHGADPTLKDEYGISAGERADRLVKGQFFASHAKFIVDSAIRRIDKCDLQQFYDRTRRKQINSLHIDSRIQWCRHLNPMTISERLWKFGAYAYGHHLFGQVKELVKKFMENLASEITRRDSRFETRVVLVGSSNEGSKLDTPDEFDFNLVLTNISRICEVVSSPELDPGFVRIRRKEGEVTDTEESAFDSFFDNNGILITEKINALFKSLMTSVLTDTRFVKDQRCFDWECDLNVNGIAPFELEDKLFSKLKLNYMRLDPGNEKIVNEISIDVVPCIHIGGWWPDEAMSDISEDIKEFGCNLVFDWPQRLYPWVPYSESCARISFAAAESEIIKRSSDAAKQAFMIGKQMIANTNTSTRRFNSSYVLKTCLLHCIGALTRTSETTLGPDPLRDQIDYRVWLEAIMKCHFDFVLQDFCPCYLMPSFCLPIGKYLKSFHMRCLLDAAYEFPEVYLDAYMMYRSVSLHASDLCFQLPVLNPLSECFDQKTMLNDLCRNACKTLETIPDDCDYSGSEYCDDWCGTTERLDSEFFQTLCRPTSKPVSN